VFESRHETPCPPASESLERVFSPPLACKGCKICQLNFLASLHLHCNQVSSLLWQWCTIAKWWLTFTCTWPASKWMSVLWLFFPEPSYVFLIVRWPFRPGSAPYLCFSMMLSAWFYRLWDLSLSVSSRYCWVIVHLSFLGLLPCSDALDCLPSAPPLFFCLIVFLISEDFTLFGRIVSLH
jgi:hypothetical protein